MPRRDFAAIGVFFSTCLAAHAQLVPQLAPYSLPSETQRALGELAGESDVLILGEIHGTQEVPAVATALLATLTKLGYGVLALEIPADQQEPLLAWATGKTATIPRFFTKSVEDGRGNMQVLSLIRQALSPPLRWQLICFDQPWENAAYEAEATSDGAHEPPAPHLQPDESVADWVRRDAEMASKLADDRLRLVPDAKVLAICGNFHAQTSRTWPSDNPLSKLWPSFAAALQNSHSAWCVRSVNVVPHSGGYFAMVTSDVGALPSAGSVQPIRSSRHVAEAEAHPLHNSRFDWELNLPRATPATFLASSAAAAPRSASLGAYDGSPESVTSRRHARWFPRKRVGDHRVCRRNR